jgi:spore coat polysaccharide biosynthesis protein SpsF
MMEHLPLNPTVRIISQARMTSSRLPGKIMLESGGKTMLQHHIDRLQSVGFPLLIATTSNIEDDVVAQYAKQKHIDCYRGDENDVLKRFYEANQLFHADVIVRVTSDCPLIDGNLIKQGIETYLALNNANCYLSNCFPRTYARGFDFEIFSASMLEEAHKLASSTNEREHVTPFMRSHPRVHMHNISQEANHGNLRLTLDTEDDLIVIKNMMEKTDSIHQGFEKIEQNLLEHPEWIALNAHVEQKKS